MTSFPPQALDKYGEDRLKTHYMDKRPGRERTLKRESRRESKIKQESDSEELPV